MTAARTEPHCHAEFYDSKWQEVSDNASVPVDEQRAEHILSAIRRWRAANPRAQPPRLIDLGCGVGWLAARLVEFGPVTGVDSSGAAIALARENAPRAAFEQADLLDAEALARLGVFSIGVSSEVIEHVPWALKQRLVAAIAGVIEPGGLVVVTTPNRHAWKPYWALPASEAWRQPVEDWCTPAQLTRLFSPQFRTRSLTTFGWEFCWSGGYRLINSVKLNGAMRQLRLGRLFDAVKARHFGLYMLAVFERRAEPSGTARR